MSSQIGLMQSRRFWPLFWAQFLGAFNDNLLKNAAILLIVYKGLTVWGLDSDKMSTFGPALLVLPFIPLSGIAGQMADHYSKTWLVQRVKLIEVFVMVLAAIGFIGNWPQLLLISILLLGVQSTFFGPIKYSILPQLLSDEELVTGNALVEMGTNIAILVGTICGGVLVAKCPPVVVGICTLVFALLGWLATFVLPPTPAEAPNLKVQYNPWTSTVDICRQSMKVRGIWLSLLAIGWFWLYGFALVALFFPYAKNVMHANEDVATLFLGLFSVGVGVGSLLCEKLSFERAELGLVPMGSIGMSLFAADLILAWKPQAGDAQAGLLDIGTFLHHPGGLRVAIDLLLVAISSGFFIVPLYTFIQARAEPEARSRIIAANNIISSLFMVGWALIQIILLQYNPVPRIFGFVAVLNAVVALYIYTVIPEFFLRFVAYILTHVMYRVKLRGLENIPREGPAVLVCNHVSFIDWLIIYGSVTRPVRFVMDAGLANNRFFGKLLRDAKVIPIASAKEHPDVLQKAMDKIAFELQQGELVCIFPEGALTKDGEVGQFKHGVEHMVERTPVQVVPLALRGLWGSYFSRRYGPAMTRPFRRFWSRIELVCGEPILPRDVHADTLRDTVCALRGEVA